MYRQGDLLFVAVEKIEDNATEDKTGIIATGESTGHMHKLRASQHTAMMIAAGMVYINAVREAAIDHQEHKTISLPPGQWKVVRQQQMTPEGWRQVAD